MNEIIFELNNDYDLQRIALNSSESPSGISYKYIFEKTYGSLTTIYNYNLNEQYNKLLQKANLSMIQQEVIPKIIGYIENIKANGLLNDELVFRLEEAQENEILITKFKDKEMSYISIDEEGDVMLSVINESNDEPVFFDNNDIDPEHLALSILQ